MIGADDASFLQLNTSSDSHFDNFANLISFEVSETFKLLRKPIDRER